MNQSVHGGGGHRGIGKNIAPRREWLIGGDRNAAAFVAMRDEFEQDAGLGLILSNVREIVANNEIILVEFFESADQGELTAGDLQPLNDVDRSIKQDPCSGIDQRMADGRQDMGLAGAALAENQEIVAILNPVAASAQRQKVLLTDSRRGLEVEAREGFPRWRFGLVTMALDAP